MSTTASSTSPPHLARLFIILGACNNNQRICDVSLISGVHFLFRLAY
jgi:hypothetical protein